MPAVSVDTSQRRRDEITNEKKYAVISSVVAVVVALILIAAFLRAWRRRRSSPAYTAVDTHNRHQSWRSLDMELAASEHVAPIPGYDKPQHFGRQANVTVTPPTPTPEPPIAHRTSAHFVDSGDGVSDSGSLWAARTMIKNTPSQLPKLIIPKSDESAVSTTLEWDNWQPLRGPANAVVARSA